MLHKEIPFLRIGLPLCAGIVTGLYFKPDLLFLSVFTLLTISVFALSLYFNKYQTNFVFGIALTLALFICGLLLFENEKISLSNLKPEPTFFHGTISDYPEEKANTFMFKVKLSRIITTTGSKVVKGSIILYIRKDTSIRNFSPGDLLTVKCTPVAITNRGNPCEFDYKFYMENLGIKYYAFLNNENIIRHKSPVNRKLIHKALIIREKIIGMYKERGVSDERLALAGAIILGQKNRIDPEQKQNFIKAGVMHIMAVSGLHAVILSLFIFRMLFFLKGRYNIIRIIITILILWAFAFVTGLTPSVLRATLMFTFLQAGNMLHRRVNGINSVLASAFILILLRPSVIFDAGFLLSYSAVIFIISFYQLFYMKVQFKNHLTDNIWQSAVVTIVAQAGTLPLTIMLFNRFPTYFILTNIIIVPLSSLLVIIGCLIPMLYPIHFISEFLALILDKLTGLTEFLTAQAAALPGSNIENIGMLPVECVILMATIFASGFFFLKKQSISVFIPFSLLILYVTAGTIKDILIRSTNELIVYNIPGSQTIGIKTGKMLNVYSDTLLIRPELQRHSATLGLSIKMDLLNKELYLFKTGEKKILVCNSLTQNILQNEIPDIAILIGSKPQIENNLIISFPNILVVSSKASSGFRMPRTDRKTSGTVFLVRKSGAFVKRI